MKAAELLGFGFALAVGETTWFEGLLLIGVYCCSRSPTISVASLIYARAKYRGKT